MGELPRGTVTFVFTDVEGSTALLKRLRNSYADVLEQHRRILRNAAAEHDGIEIDTQGDSFFFAFARAGDAVAAVVEAQRALAAHDWPPEGQVRVRIGLHTGEPEVGEQRYVGFGVHRAARISAAGHGGQTLLSNATRELVEDDLIEGVAIRELGDYRLKDVDRPERLFQLEVEGLPSSFPPLKATRVKRSHTLRRRSILGGSLAGAVAAAVAVPIFALGQGGGQRAPLEPPAVVANSVVKIDPRTNRIVGVTKVGRDPSEIAVGRNAVWVVNARDRTVSRINPSGAVDTIGGVPQADQLVVDGDQVWVSSLDQGSISRINARSGEVAASIGLPSKGAEGLALGGGYLWITSPADVRGTGVETLDRVDLGSGKLVSRIPVGKTPIFATFGFGSAWTANYDDSTVSVVRPGSSKAETLSPDCTGPLGIATGFSSVWVVCYWTKQLVRIDSRTRRVTARIPLGESPLDVSAGSGAVWVTNRASGTVLRVDPRTNKVAATIRFPASLSPQAVAAKKGGVWVTVQRCSTPDCV